LVNGLIRVLTTDPQTSLSRLYSATRRHRNLVDDDLDDAPDGDEDDDAMEGQGVAA
jgi:hypothetical protein